MLGAHQTGRSGASASLIHQMQCESLFVFDSSFLARMPGSIPEYRVGDHAHDIDIYQFFQAGRI